MKFTKKSFKTLLPILISTLALSMSKGTTKASSSSKYVVFTYEGMQGPFSGLDNPSIKFEIDNGSEMDMFHVDLSYHHTKEVFSTFSQRLGKLKLNRARLTYNADFAGKLDNGIDVHIYLVNLTSNVIDKTFTLFPILHQDIISTDYRYKDLIIKDRCFEFKSNKTFINTETISFKDTVESIGLDENNALDFSELYFTYDCGDELIKNDTDKYFVIESTVDNEIFVNKIPLILNYDNTSKEVTFSFKNPLYVNPNSLDMSLEEKSGYVQTDKYYVSNNKFKVMQKSKIYILLNSLGRNDINVTIPLSFDNGANLLGECANSDYCVVGGIKK